MSIETDHLRIYELSRVSSLPFAKREEGGGGRDREIGREKREKEQGRERERRGWEGRRERKKERNPPSCLFCMMFGQR